MISRRVMGLYLSVILPAHYHELLIEYITENYNDFNWNIKFRIYASIFIFTYFYITFFYLLTIFLLNFSEWKFWFMIDHSCFLLRYKRGGGGGWCDDNLRMRIHYELKGVNKKIDRGISLQRKLEKKRKEFLPGGLSLILFYSLPLVFYLFFFQFCWHPECFAAGQYCHFFKNEFCRLVIVILFFFFLHSKKKN